MLGHLDKVRMSERCHKLLWGDEDPLVRTEHKQTLGFLPIHKYDKVNLLLLSTNVKVTQDVEAFFDATDIFEGTLIKVSTPVLSRVLLHGLAN